MTISFNASVEDEDDVQEGDVLNLTVELERKHLPPDEGWVDSDDEDDEPDESVFAQQLEEFEEGSEEWEKRKDELMDEWRDVYFERQKRKREREEKRKPHDGRAGLRRAAAARAGARRTRRTSPSSGTSTG